MGQQQAEPWAAGNIAGRFEDSSTSTSAVCKVSGFFSVVDAAAMN